MSNYKFSLLLGAAVLTATASSAAGEPGPYAGRAAGYQAVHPDSIEHLSTPDQIRKLDVSSVPPTEIWRVLEHGEKVECLSCIPIVEKLLWSHHPKTREISAWWLRRRIFGVFGPGQVYQTVTETLLDQSQDEDVRAYAANALGEFLDRAGVPTVSQAIRTDPSAKVRAASVAALERINSSGAQGEVSFAMADTDQEVRMTALHAAIHLNSFVDIAAVAGRLSDQVPEVRRRAAEALGVMRAGDSVAGLVALSSPAQESDADVRKAAITALGQIGDPTARTAVTAALGDSNSLVRDAARVAARRLGTGA